MKGPHQRAGHALVGVTSKRKRIWLNFEISEGVGVIHGLHQLLEKQSVGNRYTTSKGAVISYEFPQRFFFPMMQLIHNYYDEY
ncbi:MAG: hypothetical protein CM15mP3_04490 [Candidatus Poseidoniales archaeon]|nr:MAG: hypothetical protein CM15mP3_04490 [Candidatus Poseidoniales archaeon]